MDIQILVKFAVNINTALQIVENSNKVLLTFRSPVKAHKFFIPYVLKYSSSPCPSLLGFRNFFKITFIIFRSNGFLSSNCEFFSSTVYHEWL